MSEFEWGEDATTGEQVLLAYLVFARTLRLLGIVAFDDDFMGSSSLSLLEYAGALVLFGVLLHRAGHRVEAREPLRAALDIAHRADAEALAARANEALVAAGGRPRRPFLSGVEALTATELRVASLAARTMTNREIAETLFVSQKTVETHLSNAFGKLGISSRRELPDALGGSGSG